MEYDINVGKKFTGLTYEIPLSDTVISDVYRSIFFKNKTVLTKNCLAQWILKFLRSFDIHWVWQYLVKFTGLADIVNATAYNTELILTGLEQGKLLWF